MAFDLLMANHKSTSDPLTPPIPAIPVFGTTWYQRGVKYWRKRAFMSFFTALPSFFMAMFVWAAIAVIVEGTHGWAKVLLLAAVILAVGWSLFTGFRAIVRIRLSMHRGQPMTLSEAHKPSNRHKGAETASMGLGVAAYGGSSLAGGLIMIGSLFGVGWVLALLLNSLARYVGPDELRAVHDVQAWYAKHPEIPDAKRPRQFRTAG